MGPGNHAVVRCLRGAGLLLAIPLLHGVLPGQAPLTANPEEPGYSRGVFLDEWKESAADRALQSGLAGLAERLYGDLLTGAGPDAATRARLAAGRAAARIARQDFPGARADLESVPEGERTDVHHLYGAVALYGDGSAVDAAALRAALDGIAEPALRAEDKPWFYLLTGLLAELENPEAPGSREAAFERAAGVAVSAEQAAFFRSLALREAIRRAPADEALAKTLRREVEASWGSPAAFSFLREHAVVLHQLGRVAEAERWIDRALSDPRSGIGAAERDQLLLLRVLLQGIDTVGGRAALRELVRNGQDRGATLPALQLLAGVESELGKAEFADFLNEMIDGAAAHPLLGQMHYLRSELALAAGDAEQAEADARLLLEQYPGLEQIDNVYRMFAFSALQRSPPQYRAAADFLNQLRERELPGGRRRLLDRLIGDCYFLKGDYADAADFYRSARNSGSDAEAGLLLRLATAELRDGQVGAAIAHLDNADSAPVLERWQVEWNLARALQARGDVETALERVGRLLESSADASVPAALDLRLRWLEASLRMKAGLTDGLPARVDALLSRIESFPEGLLEAEDARLLVTESLLLQAELLLDSGDAESGRRALSLLRESHAESGAAERSFLLEADFYAVAGNQEAAQETLLALTQRHPQSRLAPQALLEAALAAESRGSDHHAEAVRILEALVENYPEDPLVFTAKLKQGDLLRLMNDFTGAQIIYENLINRYPEHPRQYVAELARADCLLAQARGDADKLEKAARLYERLTDLPGLPVDFQAEAACKWAFILDKRGLPEEAEAVRTLAVGRLLLDQENALRLGGAGRYWMARALLDLGSRLEERGEPAEARLVYRKILAYNLPGQNLARQRSERLQASGE